MNNNHVTQRSVDVTADDLPLHCPTPDMSLWNAHPRVFIPVDQEGSARCPYCGTLYRLQGDLPKAHH